MQNSDNSKGNAMDLIQQLEGKVREKNKTIKDLEDSVRELQWMFVKDVVKHNAFRLGVLSLTVVECIIILGVYCGTKFYR